MISTVGQFDLVSNPSMSDSIDAYVPMIAHTRPKQQMKTSFTTHQYRKQVLLLFRMSGTACAESPLPSLSLSSSPSALLSDSMFTLLLSLTSRSVGCVMCLTNPLDPIPPPQANTRMWMMGGKIRASAVLANAPTRDIKSAR